MSSLTRSTRRSASGPASRVAFIALACPCLAACGSSGGQVALSDATASDSALVVPSDGSEAFDAALGDSGDASESADSVGVTTDTGDGSPADTSAGDATSASDSGTDSAPESADSVASDGASDSLPLDAISVADVVTDGGRPIDIGSLSGLILWVTADTGVDIGDAGYITTWRDRTTQHNDLACAGDCSVSVAKLGGSTALSGAFGTTKTVTPDSALGSDFFALEVAIADAPSDELLALGKEGGGLWIILAKLISGTTTLGMSFNPMSSVGHTYVPGAVYSNGAHVVAIRRVGQTFQLRVDGVVTETYTCDPTDPSGPCTFPSKGAAFGTSTDWISEALWIVGTSSDATVASIESSMRAKYHTP